MVQANFKLSSGGMGLTGGLVDAGNLFDCLYGIATGQADDSILDKYSDIRIQKYEEIINTISSANIRRLWDPSPEAIKADPFFQAVKRAETDKPFAQEMKKVSFLMPATTSRHTFGPCLLVHHSNRIPGPRRGYA